jgi:hypothetical protein
VWFNLFTQGFCGFLSSIQALIRDDSHSKINLETSVQAGEVCEPADEFDFPEYKSMEIPDKAVPPDKYSKNIGARAEAEYLQIVLSWILVCLNLLSQGFSTYI